jgi:hypothetical protein
VQRGSVLFKRAQRVVRASPKPSADPDIGFEPSLLYSSYARLQCAYDYLSKFILDCSRRFVLR